MTFSKICYPIINSIMSLQSFAPHSILHFVQAHLSLPYQPPHKGGWLYSTPPLHLTLYTLHLTLYTFPFSPLTFNPHSAVMCTAVVRRVPLPLTCQRQCFDADAVRQMHKRCAVARVKTVGQFGRTLIIPKDYERFEEHLKLLVVMMHDSAA